MWWLILCVNFTGPWGTLIFGHYCGSLCKGTVFLYELNILINGVKQIALHNVGGPNPINWRLEWTKRITFSQVRRKSPTDYLWTSSPWLASLDLEPDDPLLIWTCHSPWSCEPIPYNIFLFLSLLFFLQLIFMSLSSTS